MTIPTSEELFRMQNKGARISLLKWYIKLGKEKGWLKKVEGVTPETCANLEENEDACDSCENWNCCWGELPWEAAVSEYQRSR